MKTDAIGFLDPLALPRVAWRSRELLWQMTKRVVLQRYRGSFLGVAWSFAHPLLMLSVYTFVFTVVFKARWGADVAGASGGRGAFAVIMFCGMTVYSLFSEAVTGSCLCVVSSPNFVKKVIFPLEVLPLAQVLATFVLGLAWFALLILGALLLVGGLSATALLLPVLVVRQLALEGLRAFADRSVDTVFMLDVIEHMEKEVGRQVLVEAARVARQQVVVFTPYGFHENDAQDERSGLDAWGLHGAEMQRHRSGWLPEDFPGWRRWVCKAFHRQSKNGVEERFGAMYAILSIEAETAERPVLCPDIRRPTKEEARLQEELSRLQTLQEGCEARLAHAEAKLSALRDSKFVRASNLVRRALGKRPLET